MRSRIRLHKRTIILIVTTAVMTLVLSTAISVWLEKARDLTVPTIGTIKTSGVEAYWNTELTNKTESVNWGTIWLGTSQNVSIYVRSISNVEITLDLAMENLKFLDLNDNIIVEPANITSYVNLKWNYSETEVNPGEILQVTLTLSIGHSTDFSEFLIANGVKRFSFDIHIIASERV